MQFWGKKMLPQIFKWSDEEKAIIESKLDEGVILKNSHKFICDELSLSNIDVETGNEDVGRSSAAVPLSPSIVYS